MTLLSFVVKNMQRIPQAILAIAAIALISADPADKSKSLPPDDPADVKTVRAPAPDRVDLDADGNVTMIRADAGYMQVAYSPSVEQAFHRLRHVRSLATVYGVVLEQVKPWTALEQLDVGSANDGHLANLEEMQKLRRLWIHGGFVTDNWVRSIAKLKNLEVLTIEHTEISDACMKQIARLPRLKRLDLKDNAITDRGLSQLKGMKLEFLGLAETKITDRGIDEIKGMTTLKELDVDETEVTNAALVKLKGIPGLKVWGLPREEGPPKKKGPLQPEENRDFENGSDRELAALEGVETIRRLRVCGTAVTDAGVKSIAKLRNLEVLKIERAGITDACMKDIAGLKRLKELDLWRNQITDRGLAELKGMRLEFLGLRTTKVTDRGIDAIKDMTTLKLLDVMDTKVTNAALPKLFWGIPTLTVGGLPRVEVHEQPDDPKDVAAIEAAAIYGNMPKDNVTENIHYINAGHDNQKPSVWMKHLTGLPNLKKLTLPHGRTEDDDLALLVGLRALESLDASNSRFSDRGLRYIGSLAGLRELRLRNCTRITSAGIESLGQLSNLKGLDLDMTPVTDDALRHLAKLTKLEALTLSRNSKVTDAGLAHLAPLVNLQYLSLSGTETTDSGLVHLAPLVSLQYLDLGGTETTDSGLVHLRGLKKLRSFHGGTGVTRVGLLDLKKYAPRLSVDPTLP